MQANNAGDAKSSGGTDLSVADNNNNKINMQYAMWMFV